MKDKVLLLFFFFPKFEKKKYFQARLIYRGNLMYVTPVTFFSFDYTTRFHYLLEFFFLWMSPVNYILLFLPDQCNVSRCLTCCKNSYMQSLNLKDKKYLNLISAR